MSVFEILDIVLMILSIIVTIVIAYIDYTKNQPPNLDPKVRLLFVIQ